MQQNSQNFVNPAFADIFTGITAKMPTITFAGIIGTYAVTAGLNVYFLPLPLFIGIPAALALQFGRFAIVFTDYLNPTGTRSAWPPFIAAVATIVALTELGFSCKDMGFSDARFWAVFLFGGAVISFGYLLEINFISKGAEAFNLGSRHRPQGVQTLPGSNQVNQVNQQQQPAQLQQPAPRFTYAPNGNGVHHNGVTNLAPIGVIPQSEPTGSPRPTVQHLGSHARTEPDVQRKSLNENRITKIVEGNKTCIGCGSAFMSNHKKQQYCNDACRIASWQSRTGKTFRKGKKATA